MLTKDRGREVSRLEAFSDAVFAFSATLLVVSLEVPDTFEALIVDLKGFGAFALSFMALLLIWSVHNAFFRRYGLRDRMTVFLNSALLFVVLFYVFPLKAIAGGLAASVLGLDVPSMRLNSSDELAQLFMLYSTGFVALFLCVSLLYLHAYRSRSRLQLTLVEAFEAKLYFRHYLLFVLVGLVSIGIAWARLSIETGMPGWIYALLGPVSYAHGVFSEKQKRALPPEHDEVNVVH